MFKCDSAEWCRISGISQNNLEHVKIKTNHTIPIIDALLLNCKEAIKIMQRISSSKVQYS